ncbi:MAG: hypothetical protein HIU81_04200, partial [Acidobacteria bacterium]|nr:hypothetical protein [Acidobacteriota bacterium]
MTPSLAPEIVRPQTHKLAIWLMIAAALIQAINSLVAIASAGTIVDSAMARNRGTSTLDSHQLSQATAVAKGFVVGLFVTILIISLIVWALMIWFNLKGRNWARITATVLGGLGIISTLTSMGQTASNGLTVVLGVILLLVEIAILVLLWMKPTSAFYKAVSAQRAARNIFAQIADLHMRRPG